MNPQTAAVLASTEEDDQTDLTPEQSAEVDKQTDADMMASFASGDDEVELTATPADTASEPAESDEKETPQASAEPETKVEPAPPDPLTTALQKLNALEELSKRSVDGLGGRLGSLEAALKAMREAKTAGTVPQLKMEDFGDFGKEYPHFVEPHIAAINKALQGIQSLGLAPEFTQNLINETKTASESAVSESFNRKRWAACTEELDDTHEGWDTLVGLPTADGGTPPDTEFRRWLATQDPKYQTRVMGTYSSLVLGRAIDKFNEFKKAEAAKTATPAKPTAPVVTRKQKLNAAVTVKTAGGTPPVKKELTEDEAMMLAFKGKI